MVSASKHKKTICKIETTLVQLQPPPQSQLEYWLYSFYVRAKALLQLLRTEKERARSNRGWQQNKITTLKTKHYENII